jgi:hypothetical protein
MPRWLTVLFFAAAILAPLPAYGQTPISLASLQVQLWPEYDQPSMLVIHDFQVAAGTQLPVSVTMKFPKDANLVAVAVHQDETTLLNADYLESSAGDEWQSVIVQVQSPSTYRIEYFQPLSRSGDSRGFHFTWAGEYAVQDFNLSVRMPADATIISAVPELQRGESDGPTYFVGSDFGAWAAGRSFDFRLEYTRTTDALVAPPNELAPSQSLNGSTQGRVMLSNYYPYILGALGIVLVAGGSLYFWQSSRARSTREKRHHSSTEKAARRDDDVYCHQCGARAEPGDRFCRVCGSRLRAPG